MPERETLELVAACLEYPCAETPVLARRAAERTAGDHIALARALWDLAVWLERAPLGEAEERYTALFDLDPVCTLHVGYQVFGDTYPRGAFIANMARELRQAGVGRGSDLPDFLPVVLRLLAVTGADEAFAVAQGFARRNRPVRPAQGAHRSGRRPEMQWCACKRALQARAGRDSRCRRPCCRARLGSAA